MLFRWLRKVRKLGSNLSIRAGLFAGGAVLAALLAVVFSPYVSDDLAKLLGGDAVDRILMIIASSMLTVVTFSLSTLIAAYSVAGASAPARATAMILRDKSAQTALSTFLGGFIFSIVSIVALSTGYYGPKGRVILFGTTLFVLSSVIWTVIRWIGQLSNMGQLPTVMKEVERATIRSVDNQCHLFFDAEKRREPSDEDLVVRAAGTGFLQTIDVRGLASLCEREGNEVWVETYAGQLVYPGLPLARIPGGILSEEKLTEFRSCFFVGPSRTFEDDPRFGLVVLSEIGSRALSPGINDPGTAIEVISSLLRIVLRIREVYGGRKDCERPARVHLRPVTAAEVLDDAFHAIARDGAGNVEVGIFLQKALVAVGAYPEFATAARELAVESLQRSEAAMNAADFARVRRRSLGSPTKYPSLDSGDPTPAPAD